MQYAIRRPLTYDERSRLNTPSDLLAHLLFHRGVTEDIHAQTFLTPDYELGIHDPFLLKDAERAAVRLIQAIENKETIAMYCDYDADGIPGAAMFRDFFRRIAYDNVVIYIPHRHDEGFGLNIEAVDTLAAQGVTLLVTVDCGISDVAAVAHANTKGIEVIITDHHEPPPELPPAFAIIDHKQIDCQYPDKNLCGTGVGFKFIQAILAKNRFGLKEGTEKWLLDLVGIATLSDMVSLTGENRILAYYGLSVLRKSPRKGLMRLFTKLKMNQQHVTEDDIAFMITPRINAASRMGTPMDAFNLLSADNEEDARMYADKLEAVNTERKGVVALLVKEVKKIVRERHGNSIPSVIVLGNPDWRPSLLGLAANSCAQEFDRPVFLWGRDGDMALKGSCRSEGRTHVVEVMRGVDAGVLTQFGGHKHSGGFAVDTNQVHFLEQRLIEAMDRITAQPKENALENAGNPISRDSAHIDAEIAVDDIDWKFERELSRLAPFGVGNSKPVFLLQGIRPFSIRTFGKAQEHVEISFKKKDGNKIPAIAFFAAASEWAKAIQADSKIDLIASIEKSMFRGRAELRLRIIDVIHT